MHEQDPKTPPPVSGGDAAAREAARLEARRRFLRVGLITGPVILTLASRPAFANNGGPSVGMSGNVSTYGPNVWARLQGLTPGFWKQPQHRCYWAPDSSKPDQYKYGDAQTITVNKKTETIYVNGTLFKSVFVSSTLSPTLTMLDALKLMGGGAEALARQCTAALLNANNPNIFYRFNSDSIINMSNAAFTSGNTEELKNLFDSENNREGVGFGSCP